MTALATHGISRWRSQLPSFASGPGCGADWLWAAPVMALHLARPAWAYLPTAATALIRAASVGRDQVGLPPKPTDWAIVPSGPLLRLSHEISGGTASMATASPAVRMATQLTTLARLVPRSRSFSSGKYRRTSRISRPPQASRHRLFSQTSQGDISPSRTYGWSVHHQIMNNSSVIPAPIAGSSNHPAEVTCALMTCFPDGTATLCERRSHPHICASAYTGASATRKVKITPRSNDSTPTSTVAASGAMYPVSRRRVRSSGVPGA